jgi:prophage antirepressor-like protein
LRRYLEYFFKEGDSMSELQIFQNAEFGSVRSITVNGEPYFVGKDVAEILGYSNTRKAILDHVDEEDKGVTKCDTPGGSQELAVINESGLYSLILSSKLPGAKRFKRWVTSEVLPAIRKHGLFAMDDIVNNTDALIEALQAFKAERLQRMALESENAVQRQQLSEMKPKASYYDVVLNSPDLVSITEIAKDYGWSAQRMNEYLHERGIQFRQGGRIWILYQKYAQKGLTSTKTHTYPASDGTVHTKVHTYWTQKGRLFIYDLLKADGILPTMEREV